MSERLKAIEAAIMKYLEHRAEKDGDWYGGPHPYHDDLVIAFDGNFDVAEMARRVDAALQSIGKT